MFITEAIRAYPDIWIILVLAGFLVGVWFGVHVATRWPERDPFDE